MVRVAVVGCCHGEIKHMYDTIARMERDSGKLVDLVLVCGDFQAVRHAADLETMSVPDKYKRLGDFAKYYNGTLKAPKLTVFIGGNHEASGFMQELYHGGWVAPDIFYMGASNVIQVMGLRIGGISGIYVEPHYDLGRYETIPFDRKQVKSVYHTRKYEVFKLGHVASPVDIFMSHDWPSEMASSKTSRGNLDKLVKDKPFFRKEISEGRLGSPALNQLVSSISASHWFSAHLHCKYAAEVGNTKFLALGKCRHAKGNSSLDWLQILDVKGSLPYSKGIVYDKEWLSVARAAAPWASVGRGIHQLPDQLNLEEAKQFIETNTTPAVFRDIGGTYTNKYVNTVLGLGKTSSVNPDEIEL